MDSRRSRWAELARKSSVELRRLSRSRRLRRAPRAVAIALLASFVLYLVVGNALLRWGVAWFVNSSTSDAHLALGPSHTWFPGLVEVHDVRLRFEDRNVQFELVVPSASLRLDLFELAKKRFHVRSLDADGVRFRFRHKVTSVRGNEKRLAFFPHIEGFSDPPLSKPEPPVDKSKDWTFHLEKVRARGVELWFMEYRYAGRADVTGAFELAPGRKLWVGPAHADFVGGELTLGSKRPLGRAVAGKLDFRFRETNPDPILGLAIFRQISAKTALDTELVDLEAVNLYVAEGTPASVARGAGHVRARLELVDGRFVPESFVAYRGAEDVRLLFGNVRSSARLGAEVRARGRPNEPARLGVEATLEEVALDVGENLPSARANVTVRRAETTLVADNADVASPWKLDEAELRVSDGRVADLGALFASGAERPVLVDGSAWFRAQAELEGGSHWTGSVRVDARNALVRIGKKRLALNATLALAAESPRRDLEHGVLRDVALEVVSAELRASASEHPLRLSVRAPHVEWTDFAPGSAHGRATLAAPHTEPILLALGAPAMLISVWPDAPLDASARFAVEPNHFSLKLDLARSGPFRAMGGLSACSPPSGAFLVKNGVFSVGLALQGSDVRFVPLASDAWLARNSPDCKASE